MNCLAWHGHICIISPCSLGILKHFSSISYSKCIAMNSIKRGKQIEELIVCNGHICDIDILAICINLPCGLGILRHFYNASFMQLNNFCCISTVFVKCSAVEPNG